MVKPSVVIATCNRPQTLPDAVRSALVAGASEVVVVDDSVGQTARMAVEALVDPRVQYYANPRPTGGRPAVVRNFGWRVAKGAILHFLDDDDLVPEGHYARAAQAFASGGHGVVFGTVEPFGADAAQVEDERRYFAKAADLARRASRFGPRWGYAAALIYHPAMLVCGAGLVRREVVETIGGFDESIALCEDVEFFMRAIRHGGARFLDAPALRYRIHPSLMRAGADQTGRLVESYQRARARYRAEHSLPELAGLALLARAI